MTDPRPGLHLADDDSEGRPTDFRLSDEDEWTDDEVTAYHAEAGTLFDDPEEVDLDDY